MLNQYQDFFKSGLENMEDTSLTYFMAVHSYIIDSAKLPF